jgi:hypothetical protein
MQKFLSLALLLWQAFIPADTGCILFADLDKKSILRYILAGTYVPAPNMSLKGVANGQIT